MEKDVVSSIMNCEYSVVVRNARVLNVYTGEVLDADVGIAGGSIGEVTLDRGSLRGSAEIDAGGQFAIPGLIDSHVHIESSMVTPRWFGEAVVPKGTTTAVADPHEIANVLGVDGVRFMHADSEGGPLQVFFQAPSCVPSVPALETAGAVIGPDEISAILAMERSLGLGEVMDFAAVINGDPRMSAILRAASAAAAVDLRPRLPVAAILRHISPEGRSPIMRTSEEELEKLRGGMWVEARLSSHLRASLWWRRCSGVFPACRRTSCCALMTRCQPISSGAVT